MEKWINIPNDITKYQGFTYTIYNLANGKFYIGKKFFWSKKTLSALKGRSKKEKARRALMKNRKRHIVIESDWKTYYGSCKKLLEDIKQYGEKNFRRVIITCYKNKWDCAYHELLEQLESNVLFDKKSYNEIINIRLRKRK